MVKSETRRDWRRDPHLKLNYYFQIRIRDAAIQTSERADAVIKKPNARLLQHSVPRTRNTCIKKKY